MKRFEYQMAMFFDPHGAHNPQPPHAQVLERLNALGADGWEAFYTERGVWLLKRELDEPSALELGAAARQVR